MAPLFTGSAVIPSSQTAGWSPSDATAVDTSQSHGIMLYIKGFQPGGEAASSAIAMTMISVCNNEVLSTTQPTP
jgi:hypothetical protein